MGVTQGGPDSSAIGVPQAQADVQATRKTSCGFAAPIGKLSGPPAGIVNVTFCDGHSESLPDNTLCKGDIANTVFGMP